MFYLLPYICSIYRLCRPVPSNARNAPNNFDAGTIFSVPKKKEPRTRISRIRGPAHVEQYAPMRGAIAPYLDRPVIMSRYLHINHGDKFRIFIASKFVVIDRSTR